MDKENESNEQRNDITVEELAESYVLACVNFYGIIPVADVSDIISRQNDCEISEPRLVDIARESDHAGTDFLLLDNGFLVAAVFNNWNESEIEQYYAEIQEVPRYVPPRDTLLKYRSEIYFEVPMEADLLQVQIRLNFPEKTPEAPAAVCMVQYLVRQDADLEDIFEALKEEFDIDVHKNGEPIDSLIEAIIKVNNTTRKWITNGRTPQEALTLTGGVVGDH